MYLSKSLNEGLNILGFDRKTIKQVSREKSLEDIFLGTLFLNYIIVLIVYTVGQMTGGYSIDGRLINREVFYGLLMIYPLLFNLAVYLLYSLFGLTAEVLDEKKKVKPLLSVGFHTAIVYTIIVYIIAVTATINSTYAGILALLFILYFLYTMFVCISEVYNYSLHQTIIVLMTPFLLFGIMLLCILFLLPDVTWLLYN